MVIGFVLLSHQNPRQLARLVATLNRIYDNPPIACHHDASQSPLDPALFPSNVRFVTPSIKTDWGKFSVVESALAALRILYDEADPDWFTLLSAADYPVASADQVRADLAACGADALIDYREVGDDTETANRRFGLGNPALPHFESAGNRKMLRGRYVGAQLWLPIIRFKGVRGPRLGRHTFHLPFASPLSPFESHYRCYVGDHWFTASRAAAKALLNPTPQEHRLQRYLRTRASADECYYQSVLCNRPDIRVQRHNRRFTLWNGGGSHPAPLTTADLDRIFASGDHFARKFSHDDPVLDRIDAILVNRADEPAC